MNHFLVTGNQFGPLTHWDGVRRLEPGTALHVDGGTVTDRVYWAPEPDQALEAVDLTTATDHLIEVLVGALQERMRDRPTWLDLTGGYDSRLLALLADHAGVDFRANTRESSIYPDVPMARDIAQRKGWDWRELRTPWDWPDRLPRLLDDALAAADGRLEVLQLARVAWGHRELARSARRCSAPVAASSSRTGCSSAPTHDRTGRAPTWAAGPTWSCCGPSTSTCSRPVRTTRRGPASSTSSTGPPCATPASPPADGSTTASPTRAAAATSAPTGPRTTRSCWHRSRSTGGRPTTSRSRSTAGTRPATG